MDKGGKKTIFCWLLIIAGLFITPNLTFAAPGDVLINELAWMGNENSANDEFIELKNTTGQDIDLTGWTLVADDGTPDITLEGTIAANSCFLLERTDDSSVPNITADQIYTGALGNGGESLTLKDDQGSSIDSVNNSDGWVVGDNSTKQTMERTGSGWQTSADSGGTAKAQNSGGGQAIPPTEDRQEPDGEPGGGSTAPPPPPNQPPVADAGTDFTALVNQKLSFDASQSSDPNNDTLTFFWNFGDGATDTIASTTHTYLYPGQYIVTLLVSDDEFSDLDIITVNIYSPSVIISEFLPDPQGTDTENEWIELYNQSDQVANLTNWQLDDQEDGSSPFIFPANTLIAPKQFLVLTRPITKLALNNDNDLVRLIYPDGSVGTEVSYLAEDKEGFCIAFDGTDYFWTKIPTPGAANIISVAGLTNESNYSANNPEVTVAQAQEPMEILAQTSLAPTENFETQESPTSSTQFLGKIEGSPQNSNSQDIQAASLAQKASNQKNNLILYLSIIISASLIISWIVIRVRKRALTP